MHARGSPARSGRLFPWVWWVALLIGPLVFAGRVIHLPRRAKRTEPPRADSLAAVERELSRMVAALAAGQDRNGPESLQASLRRSGLERTGRAKVIEVRERLRAARFGGSGIDPAVLAEARALILRIRPERARSGPRWRSGTAAMLLFACATTLRGQSTSPEQLYEAGALGSAAAGFQARVQAAPEVGAYWYNLGAARFRLGRRRRGTGRLDSGGAAPSPESKCSAGTGAGPRGQRRLRQRAGSLAAHSGRIVVDRLHRVDARMGWSRGFSPGAGSLAHHARLCRSVLSAPPKGCDGGTLAR